MSARAWFYAQGQRAMALHPGIRSFGLLRLLFGMQNVPEWAREAFRQGVRDARRALTTVNSAPIIASTNNPENPK